MINPKADTSGKLSARHLLGFRPRHGSIPVAGMAAAEDDYFPNTAGLKTRGADDDIPQWYLDVFHVPERIPDTEYWLCEELECDRFSSTARFGAGRPALAA